ncbi:glycan biosynthesis hexose transferase WsfD [Blastococcus sp. SYSU D01042]
MITNSETPAAARRPWRERLGGARGPRPLAALFAIVVTVLSWAQLFAGRTVGVADNGDGTRLMCKFGLRSDPALTFTSTAWQYVPMDPGRTCDDSTFRAYSSWEWVLQPVVWLYRSTLGGGGFDLRVLGVVDSVLLGLFVGAVVLAWPGSLRARAAVGAAISVVVLDITFVAYFNSPFSDAAGLLGLVALLAAAIWLAAAERVGTRHVVVLAAIAWLVVLDKNQLVPLVALVAPLLVWRPGRRLLGAALSVVLLLSGALYLSSTGEGFTRGNTWNLWFGTVLAQSSDPRADLVKLGMDPSLEVYAGMTAWDPRAGWLEPAFLASEDQLTRGNIAGFLLRHPVRAAELVRGGVEATTATRPDYLSNVHDPAATEPELAARPNPAERLQAALAPLAWPWLPLFWGATGLVGAYQALSGRRRAWGVTLFLTGGGALLLCVSALGDGYYELAKHQLYAAFLSSLAVVLVGVAAASKAIHVAAARRRPVVDTVGPEQPEEPADTLRVDVPWLPPAPRPEVPAPLVGSR